jgi:hypothetical protein
MATKDQEQAWPLSAPAEQSELFERRENRAVPKEKVMEALGGREPRGGAQWPVAGQLVGARLNLNVLRATGVAVQTVHEGHEGAGYRKGKGFWKGKALGYCGAIEISGAFFNVNQKAREEIAAGRKHKTPMASVDGRFVSDEPTCFDGVEVSFNPKKGHLFVDGEGRALRFAEFAVVCGHRVFARGRLVWHDEASAPAREGEQPSLARVRPGRESEPWGAFNPDKLDELANRLGEAPQKEAAAAKSPSKRRASAS